MLLGCSISINIDNTEIEPSNKDKLIEVLLSQSYECNQERCEYKN